MTQEKLFMLFMCVRLVMQFIRESSDKGKIVYAFHVC
jgi:hypothetical protein